VVTAFVSTVVVPVAVASAADDPLAPLVVGFAVLGLAPSYLALAGFAYAARGRPIGAGLTLPAALLLGALELVVRGDPFAAAGAPAVLWLGVGLTAVASRVRRAR
jgi:hypothetical protein